MIKILYINRPTYTHTNRKIVKICFYPSVNEQQGGSTTTSQSNIIYSTK